MQLSFRSIAHICEIKAYMKKNPVGVKTNTNLKQICWSYMLADGRSSWFL